MDDNRIVELFFARSEQAIDELDGKYGTTLHRLSRSILGSTRDAEECVNDSYLAAWNAIPPARPDPLLAFVCRIVRNQSIARYHRDRAMKRNSTYDVALEELEGCLTAPDSVEDSVDTALLTRLLEGFLETLPRESRVIFMRRYWFSDSYADIAARVGLSEKNVSVRLTRIRSRLRGYLAEKGVLPA